MAFQLIHDGYTISEKLACGLAVTYRPMTGVEWSALVQWCSKLDPDEAGKRTAAAIASAVKDWDAMEGDKPAPITVETIGKLPTAAYLALKNVVSGFDEEGNNRLATDQKNSEAG